ncbi:dTDP-4-dehydrorhamnose reductase [Pelagibacterium sp. H642]|uniref:dTDP-4-dehydrorhamnose reductase n=1 Tax=Pelagibacterium sp. H642 TaxID=1881069 RepID=UPI002814B078|nr:dTDP-4-dehydrorhamnose reductase [Pelagibacterium sp. H642]WMT92846.1 dTDP-4-dehydrorhamnose reductase [Pelagibacterium sp. H642]
MKILVSGRSGQMANCLTERARVTPGAQVIAIGRPQLDLTDIASVHEAVMAVQPDVVVSAAAYTAVDLAEQETHAAWAVNASGAEVLAQAAQRVGAPIVHLSTDYVFAGDKQRPYVETDDPQPRSEYGRSKLAGERAVIASNASHFIVRTAWVYSPFGRNFVKTMLQLAQKQETIRVVSDQIGSPTSGLDLADAILHLCRYAHTLRPGIYHIAGGGQASWADVARRVLDASAEVGGPWAHVENVPTSTYPGTAQRPANSCLSSDLFNAALGWRLPQWPSSVGAVTRRLVQGRGLAALMASADPQIGLRS